jgi:hypothetical protein
MATKRNIIIDVKSIMLNKVRLWGISLIIMGCFSTMSFGEIDYKKMNIPDTTSNEVLFGFVNEYIKSMNLYAKNNYPANERVKIALDFFLHVGEGNVVLDFPGIEPAENFLIGSYLTQMKFENIILKYKENLTIQRCLNNGLLNEGILIEKIIINKKNNEIKEVKEFLKIKKDNFGKLKIELLFSSIFPKSFEDALCEENMIIQKSVNTISIIDKDLAIKPASENIENLNNSLIFPIYSNSPGNYPNAELVIFDRWGRPIIHKKPYKNNLKKSDIENIQPKDSTYYIRLFLNNYPEKKEINGTLTIYDGKIEEITFY